MTAAQSIAFCGWNVRGRHYFHNCRTVHQARQSPCTNMHGLLATSRTHMQMQAKKAESTTERKKHW